MKRMFGTVLLGMFLLACTPEFPDETTEQKPDVVEEETSPAPGAPPREDGGRSGCDLYQTVVGEFNGMKVPVPVECDPYYFDKGDPPPEKLNPAKQFVNES